MEIYFSNNDSKTSTVPQESCGSPYMGGSPLKMFYIHSAPVRA